MSVLTCDVEFGGVSIGEATARLGIRVDRSQLNINAADEIFCGHRLTGSVTLGRQGDTPGQQTLVPDVDHRVDGSFDVKGIRVTPDSIATGLTFSLADVDIRELAKFSKGAGRIVVLNVAVIPDDAPDEDEAADDHTPGTLKAEGPWREVPLSDLFEKTLLKSLNKAGLETVGNLSDYTASEKRLTDLDGIGPGKAAKVEETMLHFWEENEQYCDGAEGDAFPEKAESTEPEPAVA